MAEDMNDLSRFITNLGLWTSSELGHYPHGLLRGVVMPTQAASIYLSNLSSVLDHPDVGQSYHPFRIFKNSQARNANRRALEAIHTLSPTIINDVSELLTASRMQNNADRENLQNAMVTLGRIYERSDGQPLSSHEIAVIEPMKPIVKAVELTHSLMNHFPIYW
jgi:hypothetical protein